MTELYGNCFLQMTMGASTTNQAARGTDAAPSVESTSEVRWTKVAELRQAIASGRYSVSAADVARRMVDGMLGVGKRRMEGASAQYM